MKTKMKTMLLLLMMAGVSEAWAEGITARTPSGELFYSDNNLTYGGTVGGNWSFNYDVDTRRAEISVASAIAAGDVIVLYSIANQSNAVGLKIYDTDEKTVLKELPYGESVTSGDTFEQTYTVEAGDAIIGKTSFYISRGGKNCTLNIIKILRSGADDLRPNTLTADKTWTFDAFDASTAAANLVNDDLYYYNGASIEAYTNVEDHTKAIKLVNGSTLMFVVPAGTGKVDVQFLSSNGYERTLKYKIGTGELTDAGSTTSNNGSIISFGYTVDKETQIILQSNNNNRAYTTSISVKLDRETVSLGTYGYASYSCVNAIDLTDVDGATAYVATSVGDGKVSLTSVTGKIPANTGLILKGTPNSTVDIPFATSADALGETNLLQAVANQPTTVNAYGEGGTNYVLSVQSGNVVFAPIDSEQPTVTAGHAYLSSTVSSAARTLRISFDNNITSVNKVRSQLNDMIQDSYDLQGRRATHTIGGIIIINGKKYLVK